MDKITYNMDEVSVMLGLSRPTVWKLMHSGEIFTIRIGRRMLIPKEQFDKLMSGKKDWDNVPLPVQPLRSEVAQLVYEARKEIAANPRHR